MNSRKINSYTRTEVLVLLIAIGDDTTYHNYYNWSVFKYRQASMTKKSTNSFMELNGLIQIINNTSYSINYVQLQSTVNTNLTLKTTNKHRTFIGRVYDKVR